MQELTRADKLELVALYEERERRRSRRQIRTLFPDEGPLRRELYPKQLEFFRAGLEFRQRLLLAANRTSKTTSGLYELTIHLTGDYPPWWEGRRFTRPVRCWAAGDTNETVREILQHKLMGPAGAWGTGILPGDSIAKITRGAGVADTIDSVSVHWRGGEGQSMVGFKSYEQGRKAFQGVEQDVILLDEEPPQDVKTECLMRTMTTNGMLMLTFTPLQGMTPGVLEFLPGGDWTKLGPRTGGRYVVMAGWDDVPHLTEQDKAEMLAGIPPFQRDARSKGIPQLGAGAILPVPESEFLVAPFEIPVHWPKSYGLDVGWLRTAAVWGAFDREHDMRYLWSEHYMGQAEPSEHAEAIRSRGELRGVIDPASRGRSQHGGEQLIQQYRDLGLILEPANHAVEAGLFLLWQLLSSGKLKVFSSLQNWLTEFRLYRRDEHGRIVKENDHLMDATRYLAMDGFGATSAGWVIG